MIVITLKLKSGTPWRVHANQIMARHSTKFITESVPLQFDTCSGSFISSMSVLVSAHCVVSAATVPAQISVGLVNGKVLPVQDIIIHPGKNSQKKKPIMNSRLKS